MSKHLYGSNHDHSIAVMDISSKRFRKRQMHSSITARKAVHSLQRAKGVLESDFASVYLHNATLHDPAQVVPLRSSSTTKIRRTACRISFTIFRLPSEGSHAPCRGFCGSRISVSDHRLSCLRSPWPTSPIERGLKPRLCLRSPRRGHGGTLHLGVVCTVDRVVPCHVRDAIHRHGTSV
jgi:hypothetical protein